MNKKTGKKVPLILDNDTFWLDAMVAPIDVVADDAAEVSPMEASQSAVDPATELSTTAANPGNFHRGPTGLFAGSPWTRRSTVIRRCCGSNCSLRKGRRKID